MAYEVKEELWAKGWAVIWVSPNGQGRQIAVYLDKHIANHVASNLNMYEHNEINYGKAHDV